MNQNNNNSISMNPSLIMPPYQQHLMSGNTISLTGTANYKPFVSEKELIQTIANQEGEIISTMRLFWDVIPKNFRIYKDYGDRLMNNGERLRLQLSVPPSQDCKDLFNLLFQLGQFFEIIGRLFSQNFNNVSLEMAEPLNDAVMVIRNHKDLSLNEKSLKILPKAQALHIQVEKHKLEYEKFTKEAQDSIQKMKNSKQDPHLIYNLSEQVGLEEKASKAVKEMEEKKAKYKGTLEQLEQRNQQFISSLEKLTKEHQGLIEYSTDTVKRFLETCANTEVIHYENLNLITPEKAQVLKNFQIKHAGEMASDIKVAEDLQLKIDLAFARQKLADLTDGSTTHQSVSPYCQFICDTSEFYTKLAEKWGKYTTTMMQFLSDINSNEKLMIKSFRDLNIQEKKRKDQIYGPFQVAAFEFLRTLETKERNHVSFTRYLETQVIQKIDQTLKSYKQEEKTFITQIQRVAKEVITQNDKIGKQTISHEKQLVKISQMLSSNFQGQNNEKMGSFQSLMIEYQSLTESLKENYNNFKYFIQNSIEQQYDLVKSFKQQQLTLIKTLATLLHNLTSQEQTFVDQQQNIQREFFNFVDIIDTNSLIKQFKCQIINKHNVEYLDSPDERQAEDNDEEEDDENLTPVNDRAMTTEIAFQDETPQFQLIDDPNIIGQQMDPSTPVLQATDPDFSFKPVQESIQQVPPGENLIQQDIYNNKNQRMSTMVDSINGRQSILFEEQKDPKYRRHSPMTNRSMKNESFHLQKSEKLEHMNSMIDVKLSQSRRDKEAGSKTTIIQDKSKRSLLNKSQNQTGSIISPLKKQLALLSQQDGLMVDEQTQRDFDKIKMNMSQMMNMKQDELNTTSKSNSPNSKFIKEKFHGVLDGEKVVETFSCAISLKILIQGRLYVTNKRFCFHSYFNDKTIFGKETKIAIPVSNIVRVEKKTNVLVFDNSISIFTKEDKEIFFTSFMFRDQAHEVMQLQVDNYNQALAMQASNRSNSEDQASAQPEHSDNKVILNGYSVRENNGSNERNNSEGAQLNNPSEDRTYSDNMIDQGIYSAEEENKKENEEEESKEIIEIKPIFDNSSIQVTEEFKKVENERLQKVKQATPDLDKFSFVGYEETINCSLKHIFQVFMNINLKWPHLDNLSLLEWLDKYPLTNVDVSFDKPQGITDAPSFFSKSEEAAPEPEKFKQWPMSSKFSQTLTHITEKPKFMQPKTNKCSQQVETFFVSPKLIIRKSSFTLEGIPFSDSFNFDYKLTFEQIDHTQGQFKTKVKSEFRVNILKPIRFLQGTVVKETEASLKETYAQGIYKEELFKKIIQLKDKMKDRWEQLQNALPPNNVSISKISKSNKQIRPQDEQQIQEKPKPPELYESVSSEQLKVLVEPEQNIQVIHQAVDHSKDFQKLADDLAEMKDLLKKLIYAIFLVVILNAILIVMHILK